MNILSKFILCFCCLNCYVNTSFAQTQVDSIVMRYLDTVPDITKPFYNIERKGKKGVILTNFYAHPNTAIIFSSHKITTYRFGSADSHANVYFLICINFKDKTNFKIIDNQIIEDGISNLLEYLKQFNLSQPQKAELINQLIYIYR